MVHRYRMNYQDIIDKYYPPGSTRRVIYMRHCRQVADLALAIAERKGLTISRDEIEASAMLHDIGIFLCNARDIGCEGDAPYIQHGVLGAALLREIGAPETWARVAERHTGAGITCEEIARQGLPLPPGDYMPVTQLERLVCYADKFYSKSGAMQQKPLDKVRASMKRISDETLTRFEHLHEEFGN